MKVLQKRWTKEQKWTAISPFIDRKPDLVFAFAARPLLSDPAVYEDIRSQYPDSSIVTCSTAGEILGDEVLDNSICLTAVFFDKTKVEFREAKIANPDQSAEVGQQLAESLPPEGLVHVMLFSDGLLVNGTPLVQALAEKLPKNVSVTGGLVGDGADFKQTLVGLNKAPEQGNIVVIGFYGSALRVGYGSFGGWDSFGVERIITKSKNNVLYELDGKNALQLYKEYLGELAKDLPSSGLLFPLQLRIKENNGTEVPVVRTLLSVNETDQSITFAGDMPEGVPAQLMKANFEHLIEGATSAANMSIESLTDGKAELAILISCIGRKLVLKERTVEEIEEVRKVLGAQAAIAGFYSYGEICPTAASAKQCELHNQTMTITTFREEPNA